MSRMPDLGKPIVTLSHALREGGNIGSHFGEDKETDQATAEAMIDLLGFFVEYASILPARVDALEKKIAALGDETDSAATS